MLSKLLFLSPSPAISLSRPLSRISQRSSRPASRRFSASAVLRPNIAVVGGGHAGLSVALRLSTLPWTRLTRPSITLIDPKDSFVFLPMIYELALDQVEKWEIAPKFTDLLDSTQVAFVQGAIENLDLSSGAVEGSRTGSAGGELRIPFDRLILAVGAQAGGLDNVPGAKEYTLPFYTAEDAENLRERLKELKKSKKKGDVINIVVVGGGFSGVELSACIAEKFGTNASVLVVESGDRLLKDGTNWNRNTSEKALLSCGVVTEYRSRVMEVKMDEVVIRKRNGEEEERITYPADLVLWTAGSKVNNAVFDFELPLDGRGRIATDGLLQVKGYEDKIFALGDAAGMDSAEKYAGTAQVALQQAEYAAWNAWASLTGNKKLKYRYVHLGEMMVLGAKNATVSTSVGLELDGSAAWAARRLAYLARLPTDRHRSRVAASWAANPILSGMGDLVKESRKYRAGGL